MDDEKLKARILTEALPFIKEFYGKTVVVKVGGSALEDPQIKEWFATDVVLMRYVGINPVVVHGGGPQVSDLMRRLSLEVRFVDGHRVTDAAAMEVVKMVLVGKMNKEIVNLINEHGTLAVGLSGEDGGLIMARKKLHEGSEGAVDLGFVGEVDRVNPRILEDLIGDEFIPVVASIGVDERGQSYNINADLVAGALAEALGAYKLVYLTDVDGILLDLEDPSSLVPELSVKEAERMLEEGLLEKGMIPKVESCLRAVRGGVHRAHIINGRREHALILELFTDSGVGTMIYP
ncbi:MAG: acetylglutamate kinase [Candidatus Geothermincolales bacterium]